MKKTGFCLVAVILTLCLTGTLFGQVYSKYNALYSVTPDLVDEPCDMVIDESGKAVVVGVVSNGPVQQQDAAIVKFNAMGGVIWSEFHGTESDDHAQAVDIDANGNLYVAGRYGDSGELFLLKYTSSGMILWEKKYALFSSLDAAIDLVVNDQTQQVVICTHDRPNLVDDEDVLVLFYTLDGTLAYERTYEGAAVEDDAALACVYENTRLYVTGYTSTTAGNTDVLALCYDDEGTLLWDTSHDSAGRNDCGNAICLDDSGNVGIAGSITNSSGDKDALVLRLNGSDGSPIADSKWAGDSGDEDKLVSIACDGDDNLIAVGHADMQGTSMDWLILCTDDLGDIYCSLTRDGVGSQSDIAKDVLVTDPDHIYILGHEEVASGTDIVLAAFDQSLAEQWKHRYTHPGYSEDDAVAMAIDDRGYFHVLGVADADGANGSVDEDWFLTKIAPNSLTSDVSVLFWDTGGKVKFTLHAGEEYANRTYLMLVTASGNEPGMLLPHGADMLPLNWDIMTEIGFGLATTPVFDKFFGQLYPDGGNNATVNTFGPLPPEAVGVKLHFCFGLMHPWDFGSNAVTVKIM